MSKIVIPTALIFLLLTTCGPLNGMNESINETNVSNITLNLTTAQANAVWAKITTNNVEKICVNEAKREAGDYQWAVKDCICDEVVSNGIKQYYCDVFTFDPSETKHFIRITCFLSGQTCTIKSNLGTETFTFAQIEEMYD